MAILSCQFNYIYLELTTVQKWRVGLSPFMDHWQVQSMREVRAEMSDRGSEAL